MTTLNLLLVQVAVQKSSQQQFKYDIYSFILYSNLFFLFFFFSIKGIIGVLDFRKKLIDVISMPRAHHQLIPNEVQLEHSFSTTIRKELQHIGHHIQILDSGITFSSVQMIQNSTDGTIYAISDYRKDGVAAGY